LEKKQQSKKEFATVLFPSYTLPILQKGYVMTRFILFILCLVAVLPAQTVPELIAQADQFATVAFDREKAFEKLQQAEKVDPNNFDVLWRISRSYVDIGEHLPNKTDAEKEKQLEYYQKALDYAERAVLAKPNASEGYVRRAIANGRVALFKGVWSAIDYVKEVKADCEKAISINPHDAVAYYVLGRTHAKLCEKPKLIRWPLGLGWANMDEAIKNYEKALALRENFIMYRLDAARAYIEEGNKVKAREYLIAISAYPKQDEDDDQYRQEAKELLEKLK
jgi:tetratricopeptide (TPR) repeat protein